MKLQRQTVIEPQMLCEIHKQYYVIHNSSLEFGSQSDRLKFVTEKLRRNLQFAVADCFYKPVETLGLALSLVQARFRSFRRRGRCLEPPNVQIPLIAPRGRLLWRLTHGHDSDLTAGL